MEDQEIDGHILFPLRGRPMRPLPRRAQGRRLNMRVSSAVKASKSRDSSSGRTSEEGSKSRPSCAVRFKSSVTSSDLALSTSTSSLSDLGIAMALMKLPGLSGHSSSTSGTSSSGSGWSHKNEQVAEPMSGRQGPRSKRQDSFEVERRSIDLSELWSPVTNKYKGEGEYVPPLTSNATNVLLHPSLCSSYPKIGHRLTFQKIKRLADGNGTTSLEVVKLRNRFWALKKCFAPQHGDNYQKAKKALHELKNEVKIYRRIEEASGRTSLDGFHFIMTAGASLTLRQHGEDGKVSEGSTGSHFGLLLPLMSVDLWDYLTVNETPLPRKQVRKMIAQMGLGIFSLHEAGVFHRDIKPENIFLDAQGNVKIGDFGLSKIPDRSKPLIAGKGYAQGVAGTRGFLAPEVIGGDWYGIEADYWSLGCVLVELATGETINKFNFEKDEPLLEWASIYKTSLQRRKYFLSQLSDLRPDDAVVDLLCKLLDPLPTSRAGIADMLVHEFFVRNDGLSEFSHLQSPKAEARPLTKQSVLLTSEDRTTPTIYYTSELSDNSQFSWINPSHESDLIETFI